MFVKLESPDYHDGHGARTFYIKSGSITAVVFADWAPHGGWIYFDGERQFVTGKREELLELVEPKPR